MAEFLRWQGENGRFAGVTQLVECHLAKVVVEGSSPFARSVGLQTAE